jgi:hypothetical protein
MNDDTTPPLENASVGPEGSAPEYMASADAAAEGAAPEGAAAEGAAAESAALDRDPRAEPARSTNVFYASDVRFENFKFGNMYSSKAPGVKLCKVTAVDNPGPIYVQFEACGGKIPPKWGVDYSIQTGKTSINFSVPHAETFETLTAVQDNMKSFYKKNRNAWSRNMDDRNIEDYFQKLIDKKPKMEGPVGDKTPVPGEFWDPSVKVTVPMDESKTPQCVIEDTAGNPVELEDLKGRVWDTVVVELACVYFQSKQWGFGPKTVRRVVVRDDAHGGSDYANMVLAKRPSGGTSSYESVKRHKA